jgi:hypothetical protein
LSFSLPDDDNTSDEVVEIIANEDETITLNLIENENLVDQLDDPEVVLGQLDLLANIDADKTQIWGKYQRKLNFFNNLMYRELLKLRISLNIFRNNHNFISNSFHRY